MYRTVETSFWTDPVVRKLSAEARMLFLYCITNNHTHVSGIYYLPDVVASHEVGIPVRDLDTLWHTLSSVGLLRRDLERELVWVVNMLRYQGAGEKTFKSAANQLATLHNSPLIKDFLQRYPDVKQYCDDRVSHRASIPHPSLAIGTGTGLGEGEGGELPGKPGPTPTQKPEKAKPRKQPTGPHHELVRFFCEQWQETYGTEYDMGGGRGGAHVKWILDHSESVEEAKAIILAFLADKSPRVVEACHPLGFIVSGFNKYRVCVKGSANGGSDGFEGRSLEPEDLKLIRESKPAEVSQ